MKKIAITGTTRGIGAATKTLFEQSDTVWSLNRPEYDVANIDTLRNVDFTNVDVLILNAGKANKQYLRDQTDHDVVNTINLNLTGNVFLVKKYLEQRTEGTIVYISSSCVTRHASHLTLSTYVAAKSGMSAFIDELRYDLAKFQPNIRLVDIKPGATRATTEKFDITGRIPSTYSEVAQGIKFAVEHPSIINLDFKKH
jgi:NADP-dependent 3-hydroxy acid dehydrogenase YdfG